MKIVIGIGYQQDLELARAVSRCVEMGVVRLRFYDTEGAEVGSMPLEPDYIEEDGSGFFFEDRRYWFPEPTRVASMVMETPVGRAEFRLDNCGIIHALHPEHVHEVKPCELLKLDFRYGYDAEVTEPPLIR